MRSKIVYSLALYLSCASGLWAQSAFTNLNFESATLVPVDPSDPLSGVYLSSALLSWSGFVGTNRLNAVLHDDVFISTAGISIFDANFTEVVEPVLQGNYTVFLQAGANPFGPGSVATSLSQTGVIPSGVRSLSFLATSYNAPFTVSLGGVNLNLISLPVTNHNYKVYEADVSAFAEQTTELTFMVSAQNEQYGWLYLDAIQFSPQSIPEPSGLSLLAIGILGLVFWHRTRPKTA